MTAGVHNFTIEQGADFSLPLLYQDENGNPIDLTGWSADMMIRTTVDSPTPLISLSSSLGGGITLGGPAGTIVISIDETTTQQFAGGIAVYDLLLLNSLGKHERTLQGQVFISPAVTR